MKNWLFPIWVIIDVMVLICVIGLWIAAPEYKTLNVSLTLFCFCLAGLLALAKWREINVFVKSKYFKKVLFHSTNIMLVLSILGLVNYLGNKNFKEFDLTVQKRNSLTEQTKKVLEMIKAPLTMTVFSKREEWQGILTLLKLYTSANKSIKLTAVDTDLRPDLVKEQGITQNGTVVVDYKGEISKFPIIDELSVTNALMKILRTEKITLYFVTGHQELSCDEKSAEGISLLCEKLRSQNYAVKSLDLTTMTSVPADATAILILGPVSGFLTHEAQMLEKYLQTGGSVFLALAPAFKSEMYDNLVNLARPYGLELGKDIVVDRMSTVQGAEATIPIVTTYDQHHPITAGFNLRTIFPLSSSVRTIEGKDAAALLAYTSNFPGSWAETDLKGVTKGKAEFQEKSDLRGPIGLMGVGEGIKGPSEDSRFVLLGSSSFLINAYQNQSGNTTLFLNAVSWIVNDEGIISFNRPGLNEEPVVLSAQHLQMIFVISIVLVPLIFFGAGILVYRRRRLL